MGDPVAQFSLGVMYDFGEGVPEDDAEAVRWYRKAADQGLAQAQHNLGTLYANGEGVPQDHVIALMWLILSRAGGDERAQSLLASIGRRATGEQIATAQKLAREWHEQHSQQAEED